MLFTKRTLSNTTYCRLIISLLTLFIASATDAQEFSKYVKLDSIIYPTKRKVAYEYDDKGRQVCLIDTYNYGLGNYSYLSNRYDFDFWYDGRIYSCKYSRNTSKNYPYYNVIYNREFTYDEINNNLIREDYTPGFLSRVFLTRTYDGSGRPTGANRITFASYDGLSYENSWAVEYHNNGKIKSYTTSDNRGNYTIPYYLDELAMLEHSGTEKPNTINKSSYDQEGHLLYIGRNFANKETDYNVTVFEGTEISYSYDSNSYMVSSLEIFKRNLDKEDDAYIDNVIGREYYENGWKGYEYNNYYATKPTYDSNNRIIKKDIYKKDYWGTLYDIEFTEEFTYDNNGSQSSHHFYGKNYDGFKEIYNYDDNNRLVSESVNKFWNYRNSSDLIYEFKYEYDETGNKIKKDEFRNISHSSPIDSKEYDTNGNLIAETIGNCKYVYEYDKKNNVNSVSLYYETELREKIEYDTSIPSFKAGGTLRETYDTEGLDDIYWNNATSSMTHLVYLFDQPFKVKSYKTYSNGVEQEVKLYYSSFIDIEGDVNSDGVVNIDDVSAVISVICGGNSNEKADANKDNKVDIDDVSHIINIICGNK